MPPPSPPLDQPPSRPALHLLSSSIPPTTLLAILHEALRMLDADIDGLEVKAKKGEEVGEMEMEKRLRELGRQRGGLRGDMAWLERHIAVTGVEVGGEGEGRE